jgi:hypothetical protein
MQGKWQPTGIMYVKSSPAKSARRRGAETSAKRCFKWRGFGLLTSVILVRSRTRLGRSGT